MITAERSTRLHLASFQDHSIIKCSPDTVDVSTSVLIPSVVASLNRHDDLINRLQWRREGKRKINVRLGSEQ